MFASSGNIIYDTEFTDKGLDQPGDNITTFKPHNLVYDLGLEPAHHGQKTYG